MKAIDASKQVIWLKKMDKLCRRDDGRWSELIEDIFLLIVNNEQLSLGDIVRMALVCKPWRSTIIEKIWYDLHINSNIGKTSLPWLMLAENSSNDDNIDKRGFFNPATGGVTELYLPEATGRRCCGSSHGWIVTMGRDLDISILNPLTREQLNLPSQLTMDKFSNGITNKSLHRFFSKTDIFHAFIKRTILTCSPRSDTIECMVVCSFDMAGYQLACAKPGDSVWTLLPNGYRKEDGNESVVNDFTFYEGQLYGMSNFGELVVMDLYDEHKWKVLSPQLGLICNDLFEPCLFDFYLTEKEGTFYGVVRHRTFDQHGRYELRNRTERVSVFKLLKENWCQIHDIGDCCLFLGLNQTILLSPVPRGFRANCIYFTDDYFKFRTLNFYPLRGYDMAVYSLETNELAPFYEGSLSPFNPPLWVTFNSTL